MGDQSGQICKDEFSKIIAELIRVKTPSDVPQERFEHYWREADIDQSGQIDFEEFLIWYQSIAKTGSLNPEAFYATFGVARIQTLSKRLSQPRVLPQTDSEGAAEGG